VTFIPPTPELQVAAGRFLVSPDDDPAIGLVDAPVVVIEFSDYQCQFCGKFARETLHPLLELYQDRIRFVYRDFVIYGPVSFQAALSAKCADEQGAFWLYHDRLFEQQNRLGPSFFFAMAEELNLDMQQFARCVSDPAVEDEVKADTADGQALGIRGTPTFYINGRILVGAQPLEAFAAVIDEELASVSPDSSGGTLQDTAHDP
jgi:protein-disulfide isomerase